MHVVSLITTCEHQAGKSLRHSAERRLLIQLDRPWSLAGGGYPKIRQEGNDPHLPSRQVDNTRLTRHVPLYHNNLNTRKFWSFIDIMARDSVSGNISGNSTEATHKVVENVSVEGSCSLAREINDEHGDD